MKVLSLVLFSLALFSLKAQSIDENMQVIPIVKSKMIPQGTEYEAKLFFNRDVGEFDVELKLSERSFLVEWHYDKEYQFFSLVGQTNQFGMYFVDGKVQLKKEDKIIKEIPVHLEFVVSDVYIKVFNQNLSKLILSGCESDIIITAPEMIANELDVRCTNCRGGRLKMINKQLGKYKITPDSTGIVKLQVQKDSKTLKELMLIAKEPDLPLTYFAGITSEGNAKFEKINQAQGIVVKHAGAHCLYKWKVTSFDMVVLLKNNTYQTFSSQTNRVTEEMKNALNQKVEYIEIVNIKAEGDTEEVTLHPIRIKVD